MKVNHKIMGVIIVCIVPRSVLLIPTCVMSRCAYQDQSFHPQQWESTFRTTLIGLTYAHHNQNNRCLQISCLPIGSRSLPTNTAYTRGWQSQNQHALWRVYQDQSFHPQQWESTFRTTFIGLTCAHHNQNNGCLQVSACLPPVRFLVTNTSYTRWQSQNQHASWCAYQDQSFHPLQWESTFRTTIIIDLTCCAHHNQNNSGWVVCRFLASSLQVPDH